MPAFFNGNTVAVWLLPGLLAASASGQNGRLEVREGEVFDRQTSLTWKRCSVGQQWQGEHGAGQCAGPVKTYTWDEARRMNEEGWRLPTRDELLTLVDQDRKSRHILPKIDTVAFPGLPKDSPLDYWTSAPASCSDDPVGGCGYYVSFTNRGTDDVFYMPHSFPLPVRLVRTGVPTKGVPTTGVPTTGAAPPSSSGRWLLNGGEALDRQTGLVWQRCDDGRRFEKDLGCQGAARQHSLAEARGMGGNGWRLPTARELGTLLDMQRQGRAFIDETVFPDMEGAVYFSSTPYGTSTTQVMCVDFHIGGMPTSCGAYPQHVRLVRNGR